MYKERKFNVSAATDFWKLATSLSIEKLKRKFKKYSSDIIKSNKARRKRANKQISLAD